MQTQPLSKNNQHFILTTDRLIRSALKADLEALCEGDTNTKIIEELGITHGAARVDIAVVNGIIHGYELKSDLDTLNRLPGQIKVYNSVLDKVTLVVGKTHLVDSIKIIPDWWGITVAKFIDAEQGVAFFKIREPEQNPEQDSVAMAALLWRAEALNILEEIGQANGVRSKPRKDIYERLAKALTKQELGEAVREQLRVRANWRSDLRCMPNGG